MKRDDLGQSLVEFALILPVILILLVGVFDLGRAVMLSETLNTAVREGTRYAIVHGALASPPSGPAPLTSTAVTAVVQQYAIGINSTLTVTNSYPDGNSYRGSRVIVTATTPFTPILSQVFTGGGLAVTLQAGSRMVIQQ